MPEYLATRNRHYNKYTPFWGASCMHKLLEKLCKDHGNLEKILTLLSTQQDHFFAGRESNFDLKIELLEYLETYADMGHHPLENLIFDTVRTELNEEQTELIDRLQAQHDSLVQLTRTFRQSLENVLQGGVMPREELEVQGREYVALQRQHIALEEAEAFPLIEEKMTDEKWREVAINMPRYDDPVFESPDKVRFTTLFEYLSNNH
ncbi:MAG: hemerythrin domain-containing protein [Chromatiales bacterium]|nr:hemerythrin domain-containing protein [Chromatiales bacterium]